VPGEHADPIGDDAHSPVAGIVHRLSRPGAVQAWFTSARCIAASAFLSPRNGRARGKATTLLAGARTTMRWPISAAHKEIWEVILTGGDPLVLSPRRAGGGPWRNLRPSTMSGSYEFTRGLPVAETLAPSAPR